MPKTKGAHSLYRFFDASERLLYIGISSSLLVRLYSHYRTKEWMHEVRNITIENFADRDSLEIAERDAIKKEKPFRNVILNQKKERPLVVEAKQRQRDYFSFRINEYMESSGEQWVSLARDLGICKTALSRWKNAKICPSQDMLKKIEELTCGAVSASEFDLDNFKENC